MKLNLRCRADLPKSGAITSANLLAFGILWLIQFPFAFIHPSKMAMVFKIKSVIAPIGLIVTMIWAVVRIYLLFLFLLFFTFQSSWQL